MSGKLRITNERILAAAIDENARGHIRAGMTSKLTLNEIVPATSASPLAPRRSLLWLFSAVAGLALGAAGMAFLQRRQMDAPPEPVPRPHNVAMAPITRPMSPPAPASTPPAIETSAAAQLTNEITPGQEASPPQASPEPTSIHEQPVAAAHPAPKPAAATAGKASSATVKPIASETPAKPPLRIDAIAMAAGHDGRAQPSTVPDLIEEARPGDRIENYRAGQTLPTGEYVRTVDPVGRMVVTTSRVITFR